jgi:HK97 family phage prohead protease
MTPHADEDYSDFMSRCTAAYDAEECTLLWDEARTGKGANFERRAAPLEIRAKGRRLEGYAATFGVEAKLPGFTEVLTSGAFAASLRSSADILCLVDHDTSRVLARTRSKTLRLSEDIRGLAFDLDLPDTGAGRDVRELAERGDLGGMSFGFVVDKDGETWSGNKRTLTRVDLREISVVSSWPAYEGTSVNARAKITQTGVFFRLALARRYLDIIGGR